MWKRMRKLEAEKPKADFFIEAEAETELVNIKWMEAEAEAEAVKKIAEVEAIKIYRFYRFHYSGIRGKISCF